jgi:thioesterase domain-containing protein/acyl carrier protein
MLDQRESSGTDSELRDETAAQVVAICRKLLKSDNFGLDDNFFESGGNSLLAMVLVTELENQFGIKIGSEALFGRQTVRELCASLNGGVKAGPVSVLPLTSAPARGSLYFIHAAFEFSPLCEALSPDILASFVTINDSGWLGQLMANNDISNVLDQLSGAYAEAIVSVHQGGPFYLAGHSSGGIFAIETARKLTIRGVTPDYVFLFDTYLQSWLPRMTYDVLHNALIVQKMRSVVGNCWDRLVVRRSDRLNSKKSSASDQPHSEIEFGSLLTTLREKAAEAYRGPDQALDCHTVLFQASKMVDGRSKRINPDLGWANVLKSKLIVITVAADHFDMVKGQHASNLAEEIKRLARISSNHH